ncbi:MAG: hypothetical protein K2M09_03565 [Muribaculaceae bacterium]|nr:hypothetical protein [Muribaculaceae bacterium]MDE6262366.1 hypothetical protein [Muribaculaceae bacterium]
MSEEEEIRLFERIGEGIREAQRRLYEHEAKLGRNVVVADSDGKPYEIPAEEALRRYF